MHFGTCNYIEIMCQIEFVFFEDLFYVLKPIYQIIVFGTILTFVLQVSTCQIIVPFPKIMYFIKKRVGNMWSMT